MTAQIRLRETSLDVFPMCLGGGVFAWTANREQSFAILDAYAERGGNFIDTADTYGSWVEDNPPGASELVIGEWLQTRGNRNEMIIATKVGQMPGHEGLSASNILECAEGSLRRLGIDHIDLYYAHEDDPTVELSETMTAFDELIRRGWLRYVAASNYSADRLTEAVTVSRELKVARYVALQTHYNLVERDLYESELQEVCEREGLVCLPYHSVANGFLTGKYRRSPGEVDSVRAEAAGRYRNEAGFAILGEVETIARGHGVAPGAVALAWLLARPTVGVPVASARTVDQLVELLDVRELVLEPAEIKRLDMVSSPLRVLGAE